MNKPVQSPNIPAGFFKGDNRMEFFTVGIDTWVQTDGDKTLLADASEDIKNIIREDMESRPRAVLALNDAGICDPDQQIIQYTRCCFGGYDGEADVVDGKVIHMEYWDCGSRGECKYEGILCCSIKVGDYRITLREIELIHEICTGIPDKQISDRMGIEDGTLNSMKRRLCEKIGGHTKLDIMNFAIRKHIFSPNDYC